MCVCSGCSGDCHFPILFLNLDFFRLILQCPPGFQVKVLILNYNLEMND